jgi:hypothetical protein
MAFIVEDGNGLSTATSYVSVAESITYFATYGTEANNTTWTGLTTAQQERALNNGTQFVDNQYYFPGTKSTTTQALNWPRDDAYDCSGELWSGIPTKLKDAVCEAALRSLSGDLLSDGSTDGDTKKVKVDVIEQEYFEGTTRNNPYTIIDNLLLTNCVATGNRDQQSNQLLNIRI